MTEPPTTTTPSRNAGLPAGSAWIGLALLVVFAAAVLLLAVGRDTDGSPQRLAGAEATRAALKDPSVRKYVRTERYDRTQATPLDEDLMRVTFFAGPRVLIDAAVAPDGRVRHTQIYQANYIRAGSQIAQTPLSLLVLAAVFLLMTLTLPLISLRNLDLLALLSLAVSIYTLNERLFELSAWLSAPGLLYLTLRCLARGLGYPRRQISSVAVFDRLTGSFDSPRRKRLLAWLLAATIGAIAMFSIPGGSVGDVGVASLSGATNLLEGNSPYGNITTDVVHGDTYPFLTYLLYIPAALLTPLHTRFDNPDGALWLTVACALVVAYCMFVVARRADGTAFGLRQSIAWIVFPPVLITTSAGSNDLVTAAFIGAALVSFAHAARSSAALSAAAWVKVVPALALPLWVARLRDNGWQRALAVCAVVSAAILLVLTIVGGGTAVTSMFDGLRFQASRGSLLSVWTQLDLPALQIVFQALTITVAALAAILAWRDRSLAGDLVRISALAAAILLGTQLGANYWSYAYLPWVYPLIAVALMWPARARDGEPAASVAAMRSNA